MRFIGRLHLNALPPELLPLLLREQFRRNDGACLQALRPGGQLLIRDHGFLDITHLRSAAPQALDQQSLQGNACNVACQVLSYVWLSGRLEGEQQISSNFFRRSDGTTCYFFSTEDLVARARRAGFATVECSYACTSLRNRKRQLDMKRVFVHGVFTKPA